jgi:hypothetical protein
MDRQPNVAPASWPAVARASTPALVQAQLLNHTALALRFVAHRFSRGASTVHGFAFVQLLHKAGVVVMVMMMMMVGVYNYHHLRLHRDWRHEAESKH